VALYKCLIRIRVLKKEVNFYHLPCHTAAKYLELGCMKHIISEETNHQRSIMDVISNVSITVINSCHEL
jgi:hypothetical protein